MERERLEKERERLEWGQHKHNQERILDTEAAVDQHFAESLTRLACQQVGALCLLSLFTVKCVLSVFVKGKSMCWWWRSACMQNFMTVHAISSAGRK